MNEAYQHLNGGDLPLLIVADHASNHVPDDIDLGIEAHLLNEHIAVDVGVAVVAQLLSEKLGCHAILGGVSRLVIDFNREEDSSGLVPLNSDGYCITGNIGADIQHRLERFYHPYHHAISHQIAQMNSPFILSLHSFTPHLSSDPEQGRPWEIGVLYNQDDRAARIAIPMLEQAGLCVGDQLPYSGTLLNATMNRHAEANAIPYLGIEMRQDISGTQEGQQRFANILAPILQRCHQSLQGDRQ
jgi:predicted N-formylglutamate amidohydrolase